MERLGVLLSFLCLHHPLALRTDSRRLPQEVVVIQGTNRPMYNESNSSQVASDWLSALQVSEYARRQGYAYRMYVYRAPYEDACRHPEHGPLKAQWCKLLAIRLAMREFPNSEAYLWMDTDAFIDDMHWRVQDVMLFKPIVRYQDLEDTSACTVAEPPKGRAGVSVFSWRNSGWDGHCGPNSGAMIIRNTATARQFMEDWWDSAMAQGIRGPYDQGFLRDFLYAKHPDKVAVFEEDTLSHWIPTFIKHSCRMCKSNPTVRDAWQNYVKKQALGPGIFGSLQGDTLSGEVLGPLLTKLGGSISMEIRDGNLTAT